MARGKRNTDNRNVEPLDPNTPVFKQPDKLRFVNVYLDEQDKQWLGDNWKDAWLHISEFMDTAQERYLRINVGYDEKSSRWNAFAACCASNSPDFGKALSVRGATAIAALFGLAYADGFKDGAWEVRTDGNTSLFG